MFGTTYRALLALLLCSVIAVPAAWADDDDDDDDDDDALELSEDLQEDVTLRAIRRHLDAWQAIADANNDNRQSGEAGYDRSVDYVADQLEAVGYTVVRQAFEFPFYQELSDPELEQISPVPTTYVANDPAGFNTMTYSGSGNATALLQAVDLVLPPAAAANTSTSGCDEADFVGFVPGNIALVQRGNCSFELKAKRAQEAGAVGVIIFNEGQPGRVDAINGTLSPGALSSTPDPDDPSKTLPAVTVPVYGAAFAIGDELAALLSGGPVTARVAAATISEVRITENVLADTHSGNPNQTIVVGAHLDSVGNGPGIQDNGTGSGAILEIAIQLAEYDEADDDDDDDEGLRNRVRFAWWGAEELGLLGSEFYVANATQAELDEIAMNLNFDMIGSPNFVRFIYDGDGSDTAVVGPPGSEHIEQMFINHFVGKGLAVEPTEFSGRSDYGPFIAAGVDIPAGGLFTGAEVVKTQDLADVYGGTVGEPFDPCYHTPCDTIDNVNFEVLDQMSDAAAHSVAFYASRDDLFAPQPQLVPVSVTAGLTSGGGAHDHDHDHDHGHGDETH